MGNAAFPQMPGNAARRGDMRTLFTQHADSTRTAAIFHSGFPLDHSGNPSGIAVIGSNPGDIVQPGEHRFLLSCAAGGSGVAVTAYDAAHIGIALNLVGVAGALHIRDTAHLAFIVANTAACVYSGAVKVYRQHELRYRRFFVCRLQLSALIRGGIVRIPCNTAHILSVTVNRAPKFDFPLKIRRNACYSAIVVGRNAPNHVFSGNGLSVQFRLYNAALGLIQAHDAAYIILRLLAQARRLAQIDASFVDLHQSPGVGA